MTSEPLSAEEEARVRRNVADLLRADWGAEPGTAYHPEEMCQSERELIRLLATLDAARAQGRAEALDVEALTRAVLDEATHERWGDLHSIRWASETFAALVAERYAAIKENQP